jgi:hypothetical protein
VTDYPKPDAPFSEVLAAAIADLSATGYVSADRVADWLTRLRNAAERDLGPEWAVDVQVRAEMQRLLDRFVNGAKIAQFVPGVGRFTKEMVEPKLYAELDRRIIAAADLIKYNRKAAVDKTLRRFSGWATSIPPGGDDTINKRDTKTMLRKELVEFRYHQRLVKNDQGHKLIANVADLVATEAGAVAGVWHSHGATDRHYDARKDHLARNGKTYLIRGSWADREGLLRAVNGYTDQVTAPAVEINCRCWYQYVLSPRRLQDEYLTRKGQEWLEEGRRELQRRMMA